MIRNILVFSMLVLMGCSQKAEAYIDPGSGSMVIQIVIATFAGLIYAIKLQWNNLKVFFSSITRKSDD